jgi:hypothetical protein
MRFAEHRQLKMTDFCLLTFFTFNDSSLFHSNLCCVKILQVIIRTLYPDFVFLSPYFISPHHLYFYIFFHLVTAVISFFTVVKQLNKLISVMRRDSLVGIATGYGLDYRKDGVQVPVGLRIFSSRHPDRRWGQPRLFSNGYWGLFTRG